MDFFLPPVLLVGPPGTIHFHIRRKPLGWRVCAKLEGLERVYPSTRNTKQREPHFTKINKIEVPAGFVYSNPARRSLWELTRPPSELKKGKVV